MQVGKILFEKPALDGSERRITSYQALLGLDSRNGSGQLGQLGDRLTLENIPGSKPETCLIGSGDDLNAHNRIAAQRRKEVIVNSHLLGSENLRPDVRQQ